MSASLAALNRYERIHLVGHLLAAGRQGHILRLLRLEDDGRNGWFELRSADGDEAGYLDDLRMATEALAGDDGATVARHAFYTLVGASITARSSDLRASLVLALIRHGFWTFERALAHARRVPDPADRAAVLCELATSPARQGQELEAEALATISEVWDPKRRTELLTELAPSLSRRPDVEVALELLRDAYDFEREVATVFERLAPNIPADLIDTALDSAAQADHDYQRSARLAALAVNLPATHREQVVDMALADVLMTGRGARQLMDLLPRLAGGRRDDAFAALRTDVCRGHVAGDDLAHGRDRLSPHELTLLTEDVLAMADETERARTLAALLPALEGPIRSGALDVVGRFLRGPTDHYAMAEIIRLAGQHVRVADREQLIARVLESRLPGNPWGYDVALLLRLAEHMSTAQQRLALQRVREVENPRHDEWDRRGPALGGLIARLHAELLPASIEALDEIEDRFGWMQAAGQLAQRAAVDLKPELLERARMTDDFASTMLWADLLSALPERERQPLLAEALEHVITPSHSRGHDFDTLVALLPADLLVHTLNTLQRIGDDTVAAEALAALLGFVEHHDIDISALMTPRTPELSGRPAAGMVIAPLLEFLAPADCDRILAQVLAEARRAEHGPSYALLHLLPSLSYPDLERLYEESGDHAVLRALFSRAPESARRRWAEELLSATEGAERVHQRVAAVAPAIDYLGPEVGELMLAWTVEMLRGVWTEPDFAAGLGAIGPRMTNDSFRAVDDALSNGIGSQNRARAFGDLASRVPDEFVPTLLAAARDLPSGHPRAAVLARLAPRVDPAIRPDVVETTLSDLEQPAEPYSRGRRRPELADLAPLLSDDQAVRMINASSETEDAQWAEAIEAVAPWISDDLILELIPLAGELQMSARARAQIALATRVRQDTRLTLLLEAAEAIAGVSGRSDRAYYLEKLVGPAHDLPPAALATLLHSCLQALSRRGRIDLLTDLAALAPLLHRAGGESACLEAAHAVVETTRWWP